jgi:hypothetical protein
MEAKGKQCRRMDMCPKGDLGYLRAVDIRGKQIRKPSTEIL